MQELEPYLADHPFLRGIDPEKLDRVARCARMMKFDTDEYLFRSGEPATGCFLIRQGHVSLEIYDARKGPMTVQTLGEPSVVGFSWLVPPYRWCFDARALELTRLVHLDARCLTELCENDHDFGYELMKRFMAVFTQRLHAARFQLLDIYGDK